MKYANRKQKNSATVSGDFLLTLTDSMKLGPGLLVNTRKTFHAKQKCTLKRLHEVGPRDQFHGAA